MEADWVGWATPEPHDGSRLTWTDDHGITHVGTMKQHELWRLAGVQMHYLLDREVGKFLWMDAEGKRRYGTQEEWSAYWQKQPLKVTGPVTFDQASGADVVSRSWWGRFWRGMTAEGEID